MAFKATDPSCFAESRVRPWVVDEDEERAIAIASADLERTLNMTTILKANPGMSEIDKTLPEDTRASSFYSALRSLQEDDDLKRAGLPPKDCLRPIGEVYGEYFLRQQQMDESSSNGPAEGEDDVDDLTYSSSNEDFEGGSKDGNSCIAEDPDVMALLQELQMSTLSDIPPESDCESPSSLIDDSEGKIKHRPVDVSRMKIDGTVDAAPQGNLANMQQQQHIDARSTHSRASVRSSVSHISALTGSTYLSRRLREENRKQATLGKSASPQAEELAGLAQDRNILRIQKKLEEMKTRSSFGSKKKAAPFNATARKPRAASWMSRDALGVVLNANAAPAHGLNGLSGLSVGPSIQLPSPSEPVTVKEKVNVPVLPPSERPKTLGGLALQSSRSDSSLLKRPRTCDNGTAHMRGLRSLLVSSSSASLLPGSSIQKEVENALTAAAQNGVKPEDQLRNARILTRKMKEYNTIDSCWQLLDGTRPLKNGVKALTTARQREDCWQSEIERQQNLAKAPEFLAELSRGPLFPEFHIKKNRGCMAT